MRKCSRCRSTSRWEPSYFVPTYRPDRSTNRVPNQSAGTVDAADPGERLVDVEVEEAIRDLVRPWTAHSEGQASCVCGGAPVAIATLGVSRARRVGRRRRGALALGVGGGERRAPGRRRAPPRPRPCGSQPARAGFVGEARSTSLGDAISALR
jgi:hypothetical protein